MQRAIHRLTPYLGPVAQVLAERTALRAPDVKTYYQWLAEHIEDLNEQVEFLRGR